MPKYSPDFSEEFKPLDPGTYTAEVSSFEEKNSKKDGSPYLQWKLKIVDEAYLGAVVFTNTMLSGRGAGILKHFLKCIDGVYDGGEFDPNDYCGYRIGVEIELREYNGKSNPNVKGVSRVENNAPQFSNAEFTEEDIPF